MPLINNDSLPEDLYCADAVRAIDRYVIDQQGVDGFALMQAAAASAFRRLIGTWPQPSAILVLCGAGNNGGDGYLVAANARRHGIDVRCIAVAPTEKLKGDARKAWQKAIETGKRTPEQIVAMVESKYTLPESMKESILNMGATEAECTEEQA